MRFGRHVQRRRVDRSAQRLVSRARVALAVFGLAAEALVAGLARAEPTLYAPAASADGMLDLSWSRGYELWLADASWRVAPASATQVRLTDLPSGRYTFVLASCGHLPNADLGSADRCEPHPETRRTVVVAADSGRDGWQSEPAPSADPAAGTTEYAAEVGARGAAIIRVPLRTGLDANLMALGLEYDAARGGDRVRHVIDDLLSYGWHVAGLPLIHRCQIGQTSDPAGGGNLAQTTADGLCLNGELLVRVGGSHWVDGAEYRPERDPDTRVRLYAAGDGAVRFEVEHPDGGVSRFGSSSASRVGASGRAAWVGGQVRPNPDYLWGLDQKRDALGATIQISYQRFDGYGVLQPKRIVASDRVVDFRYDIRADANSIAIGPLDQVRRVSTLVRIDISAGGRPVRSYRLEHAADAAGRERMVALRECGFDAAALQQSCLQALRFSWVEVAAGAGHYPIAVTEVRDGLGADTRFRWAGAALLADSETFLVSPFGPHPLSIPDTIEQAGPRVVEMQRSDGLAPDSRQRVLYAYRGAPRQSLRSRGYLGVPEMRVTAAASGRVTYEQIHVAGPLAGRTAQRRVVDAPWGSHSRELDRIEWRHTAVDSGSGVVRPLVTATTRWRIEGSRTIAVTQVTHAVCASLPTVAGCSVPSQPVDAPVWQQVVTTTGVGVTEPAFAPAFWGDVPVRSIPATQIRGTVTRIERLSSGDSPWLRGAVTERVITHAAPRKPSRTQTERFTLLPGTWEVTQRVRYPGDPVLERTLAREFEGFPSRLVSETLRAPGVEPRVWRYSSPRSTGDSIGSGAHAWINPAGHRFQEALDHRFDQAERQIDPDGRETRYARDPFGRVIREERPDGTVLERAFERCDRADCSSVSGADVALRVTERQHAAGVAIAPSRVTYLDVLGRLLQVELSNLGDGSEWQTRRVGYDPVGRVRYVSRPVIGLPPTCVGPGPECIWYTYDQADRLIREQRPDRGYTITSYTPGSGTLIVSQTDTVYAGASLSSTRSQRRTFDSLGRLIETREASSSTAGTTSVYDYDAEGHMLSVTVNGVRVAEMTYDASGQRTRLVDASAGAVEWLWNGLGELRETRDAAGRSSRFERDVLGRLVGQTDGDGARRAWQWDPSGATGRLQGRSGPGIAEQFRYDSAARLVRVDTSLGLGSESAAGYLRELSYDQAGRLAAQRYPNGLELTYGYAPSGHLARVSSGVHALVVWQALDAFGQPSRVQYHDGQLRVRLDRDPASGRLVRARTGTASAPEAIQDHAYLWRSNGSLHRRSDLRGTTATSDDLIDLLRYDGVDRLLSQSTGARTLSYGYQANGNLIGVASTRADDHQASAFAFADPRAPYRLTGVVLDGVATGLARDAGGLATHYQPAAGPVTALQYDHASRVTGVVVGTPGASADVHDQFLYDPDGRRLLTREQWTENGSVKVRTTLELGGDFEAIRLPAGVRYDRVERIWATPVAQLVRRRIAATGAWETTFEYAHRDHLGSVEVITDAAGQILYRQSFDPFGARRRVDRQGGLRGTALTPVLDAQHLYGSLGFGGHRHLDRSGFIHMQSRLFDPRTGRFMTPDPVVQAPQIGQAFNRYSLVLNSPLSLVDPTGRFGSEPGHGHAPALGTVELVHVVGHPVRPFGPGLSLDLSVLGSGGLGPVGIAGLILGLDLPDVSALLADWLTKQSVGTSQQAPIEVVQVTAPRVQQGVSASWFGHGLNALHDAGISGLSGAFCAGAILGACGSIALGTADGALSGMLMAGVAPGFGFSFGADLSLLHLSGKRPEPVSGFGTAVFVSGGVAGLGGSLALSQGSDAVNLTASLGYGFGLGGGVGFYYATPLGGLGAGFGSP